jgi:hypothetical protein
MPNICHRANAPEVKNPNDVSSQLTEIATRGTRFTLGAQKLALYEIIQANQDALELARSGMSIAQEFISKIAQAHSVKDLTAAFRDCGHEQMDRFHRSYEHLFTHGHEVFDVSSNLVLAALRGEAAAKLSV